MKKSSHTCKIQITCGEPVAGKMTVEMNYEGDTLLALYLLEHAQGLLEEELQSLTKSDTVTLEPSNSA